MASGGLITYCLGCLIWGSLAFCCDSKLRRLEEDFEVFRPVLLTEEYVFEVWAVEKVGGLGVMKRCTERRRCSNPIVLACRADG